MLQKSVPSSKLNKPFRDNSLRLDSFAGRIESSRGVANPEFQAKKSATGVSR